MQNRGPHRLNRAASAIVLAVAIAGTPGSAGATATDLNATDTAPQDGVVLISATTLDRSSSTQTFTLTAVNVSPTATGETSVPASSPNGWTIVSATPETGVFSNGTWQRPPLAGGTSATVTIEARP